MNTYQDTLTQAGMKLVDAYRLAQTIEQFVRSGRKGHLARVFAQELKQCNNSAFALTLIRLEEKAENDRVARLATGLVEAVQAGSVAKLQQKIAEIQKTAQDEAKDYAGQGTVSYIDAELPNTGGLTALHVACGNYKLHPGSRGTINTMVELLLAAGANPFKAVGMQTKDALVGGRWCRKVVNPGRTIAEVCRGTLPPALTQWLAEFNDEGRGRVNAYNGRDEKPTQEVVDVLEQMELEAA